MVKLHAAVLLAVLGIAAGSFDPDLDAKFKSMESKEFVEYFNSLDHSFKITEYDDQDLMKFRACAKLLPEIKEHVPIQVHDPELLKDIPENFDGRDKWRRCQTISRIYDQGDCGSCWTFGTATTASDRTCIHKDIMVDLSEQEFGCLQKDVCNGGYPLLAFLYWQLVGLVTSECKPYNVEKLKQNECKQECVDSKRIYDQDKHYADRFYSLPNRTEDIKAELFHYGPVEASFAVYDDFQFYSSGIYSHKFGEYEGGHSVRVLGYGVEGGENYWLVANSWGTIWGEDGLVKIKAFDPDLGFEDQMLSGLPKN